MSYSKMQKVKEQDKIFLEDWQALVSLLDSSNRSKVFFLYHPSESGGHNSFP